MLVLSLPLPLSFKSAVIPVALGVLEKPLRVVESVRSPTNPISPPFTRMAKPGFMVILMLVFPPEVVMLAVPTTVVPLTKLMVVAEAAGTIASAAVAMTKARIERLRLVVRTTFPLLGFGTLVTKLPQARQVPIAAVG